MSTTGGTSIVAGYEWRQRLRVRSSEPAFPSGVTLVGHVRSPLESATPLATLTTADGTITRVDNETVQLVIAGATSVSWTAYEAVLLDLVRTDTDPDQHLGFRLTIPVEMPVTRAPL